MKKLLAISSALLLTACTFTSCGSDRDNSRDDDSYYDHYDYDRDGDRNDRSAGDHARDAVDGAKDAGEDIVGGVGDAARDVIDGLDGSTENDAQSTTSRSTRR
jgi:hypothetical protein